MVTILKSREQLCSPPQPPRSLAPFFDVCFASPPWVLYPLYTRGSEQAALEGAIIDGCVVLLQHLDLAARVYGLPSVLTLSSHFSSLWADRFNMQYFKCIYILLILHVDRRSFHLLCKPISAPSRR